MGLALTCCASKCYRTAAGKVAFLAQEARATVITWVRNAVVVVCVKSDAHVQVKTRNNQWEECSLW